MREIKFRVWNSNKMDYDCRDLSVWNGILVPEGDGIIMQYTGLKDKNGKEIYDGDIVNYSNTLLEIGIGIIEAFFDTTNFHCRWVSQNTEKPSIYTSTDYLGCPSEIEVIGNIYENPELTNQPN